MALINCPECGKQVSTAAKACPGCGFPMAGTAVSAPAAPPSNELLAEVRPSWWRYFWHLFFFWLIIPPIVAWFDRRSVVLRVYHGRLTLERGIVTKCYREIFIRDIRSIDVDQGVLARLVGIGDVTVSTAATSDAEEEIPGIPDPKQLRDLIIAQREAGGGPAAPAPKAE